MITLRHNRRRAAETYLLFYRVTGKIAHCIRQPDVIAALDVMGQPL